MSEPRYRDWILETIDSLRSRKARPDLERICRMVRRRYGCDPERTRCQLEKLIQEQTVLKVNYKGSVSYRNAAKVQRRSQKPLMPQAGEDAPLAAGCAHPTSHPRTSSGLSAPQERKPPTRGGGGGGDAAPHLGQRLLASLRTLAGRRRGADNLKDILALLGTQETMTRSKVKQVVEMEVARARIRGSRLRSVSLGVRRLRSAPRKPALKDTETLHTESDEEAEEEEQKMEEDTSPPCSDGEVSACEPQDTAEPDSVSITTDLGLHLDPDTEILANVVKVECPDASPSPAEHVPKQEESQEPSLGSAVSPVMLTDTVSVEYLGEAVYSSIRSNVPVEAAGLHMEIESVCSPHLQVSGAQDQVVEATGEGASVPAESGSGCKVETDISSCLLTPTASPKDVSMPEEQAMNTDIYSLVKVEKSSQNLGDWSVADVVSYFIAAGFPEQATAFQLQEIDGKSLLLMQRSDVLTGLAIRLGPALKIYEHHIKVLQQTHFQARSTLS